ncbi:hypothetical protein, partial [Salmonella enterica]|uniref:hypothetical protein n=1 Tax=Salmonella enterica TaxID=28901 RepID=UPI002FCDA9BD
AASISIKQLSIPVARFRQTREQNWLLAAPTLPASVPRNFWPAASISIKQLSIPVARFRQTREQNWLLAAPTLPA